MRAGAEVELANRFLAHLTVRGFAPATRRAYAYDLLNFLRFLDEVELRLVEVVPTDLIMLSCGPVTLRMPHEPRPA